MMSTTPGGHLLAVLALMLAHAGVGAATLVVPAGDSDVAEVLAAPTVRQLSASTSAGLPVDPVVLARQVRDAIGLARQTGDSRYWGRAQALLHASWDQADAPVNFLLLQATVQQGRHEFDAARRILEALVVRAPDQPQVWLDLAALDRLQARYAATLRACDAVERAGAALYGEACRLETVSMQGRHADATQGLQALVQVSQDPGQRSWLLSLWAEALERAGRDAAALAAYRDSLRAQSDLYTSVALSDLLLRTGQLQPALKLLQPLPRTDAVLLRQATAMRRLDDPRWQSLRAELHTRAEELLRRGDDPNLHGREAALVRLWLDDDPAGALVLARRNLTLQREPLDWWLALHSAALAHDAGAWAQLQAQREATGLQDARIDALRAPAARAPVKVKGE